MSIVFRLIQVSLGIYTLMLGTIFGADIDSLEIKIGAAPPWAGMSSEAIAHEGPKLIEAMSGVLELTPAEARGLLQKLMDNAGDYPADRIKEDAWSKAYILIRIFANVPAKPTVLPSGVAQWGGGITDATANIFWPLELRGEKIALTGVFPGYFGPPYDAITEFDILYRMYGKRQRRRESAENEGSAN